jgi:hypothetical protein
VRSFTVKGVRSGREVVIRWTRGSGFDDDPRVDWLIARGKQVGSCPTGPFFVAADHPDYVAAATAAAALDRVTGFDVVGKRPRVPGSRVPRGAVS